MEAARGFLAPKDGLLALDQARRGMAGDAGRRSKVDVTLDQFVR